jgi:hypothetical protein
MVTPRRVAHPGAQGRAIVRWALACVLLPFLVALPAAGVRGLPASQGSGVQGEGELERRSVLCPMDANDLEALAGARLGEGRMEEAEALATRLVRLHPEHARGWALLAAIRYLQDDTRGALEAWSQGRPLSVRDIDVRIVPHSGTRPAGAGAEPARLAGIAPGEPLTLEGLVRGERRLRAVPAASRARLEYRALPGGEAQVEGAVVLRGGNPFERTEWLAHGVRLLGRRVHLASADLTGHMEQWELNGSVEGTLRSGTLSLAHPAPGGAGVWRWEVHHGEGEYAPIGNEPGAATRAERTTVGWTLTQWLSATFQGRGLARIDRTRERGTLAGAGFGGTLLPLGERSSLDAEATGWLRVGGHPLEGAPADAARFGRLAIGASLHPVVPPLMGAPAGWAARAGVVAVSPDLPRDLVPRIGSGGRTDLLMRARSDLDADGVVRPLFPGRAWLHGGVEYLHPLRSVGPMGIGIGVAAFADGIQVVAAERGAAQPGGRTGAIHLGAGLRARVPAVGGWLRVDWGVDPSDGASQLSAAWVHEPPR